MTIQAFKLPSLFEVRFVDQANGCERPHTHPSLIISAVSGGHVSIQINDSEIRLRKGMVAVVGPNILHSVRSYSQNFSGIYVLDIFGLPETCKEFHSSHFQMFKSQLLQDNIAYEGFVNLCGKLLSSREDSEKIGLFSEWTYKLFVNHYPAQCRGGAEYSTFADKIRKVLDEYQGESPPFAKIAQVCGRGKEHCNRIFRRAYGISIQAYFLNKKAACARNLIPSEKSLSDIALDCGFYDQSHFSRVFKEIYQISPAKYRSIILGSRQSHTRKSNNISV